MTVISLIAAVDEKRGLGKDNKLLCHLPADLKHFKAMTLGKPIIMGRKTYQSIGKALPDRMNIVLSQGNINLLDATIVHSLEDALLLVATAPEVMIIGGAQLFQQALPFAHKMYLTQIHAQLNPDVFFPEFDKAQWCCQKKVDYPKDEKNPYSMTFCYWEKVGKKG